MKYQIKVVELHSDYVWIEADSDQEAEKKAHKEAQCEYESLYLAEATGETED